MQFVTAYVTFAPRASFACIRIAAHKASTLLTSKQANRIHSMHTPHAEDLIAVMHLIADGKNKCDFFLFFGRNCFP